MRCHTTLRPRKIGKLDDLYRDVNGEEFGGGECNESVLIGSGSGVVPPFPPCVVFFSRFFIGFMRGVPCVYIESVRIETFCA